MDYHTLSRRELQALCKLNKIPANMTNVAMADALKALELVEGIEEFLKPSESDSVKSSIESPEKSEITSTAVPRTGGRTTTRRSTRKIEMAETPAAAAPTTRRRAAGGASVRRKIEISLKESEEIEKDKKDVRESPAVVMTSRRRGVKETSSVKHVYSTRRSTRLAAKNEDAKDIFEAIKIDSFAKEMDENVEIKSAEDKIELSEVTDENGFDLRESSGKGDVEVVSEEKSKNVGDVEIGVKEEEANDTEIDVVLSSETEEHVNAEVKTGDVEDVSEEKSKNVEDVEIDIKEVETNDTEINVVLSSETEEHTNTEVKTGDVEDVSEEKSENVVDFEVDIKEEEANDNAIDAAWSSETEECVNMEEKTGDDNKALDDDMEIKPEVDSEMSNEIVVLCGGDGVEKLSDMENEVQENNGSEDVYASETVKDGGSEFVANENLESEVPEVEGCIKLGSENEEILGADEDIKTDVGSDDIDTADTIVVLQSLENVCADESVNAELTASVQDENIEADIITDVGSDENIKADTADTIVVLQSLETTCADENVNAELTASVQDENIEADIITDVGSDEIIEADSADTIIVLQSLETTCSDENVDAELTASVQDDTEGIFAAPQNLMVQQETHKESHTEFSLKPATVFAQNVIDAENFIMEISGLQNGFSGDAAASALSSETSSNAIVHSTCITPLKKKNPLSTTPMKKSAGGTPKTARRVINISNDKENVDSGRKLVVIKEEKPTKKVNNQISLEEFSMRQLTKMFKEKLEITKTNKSKASFDDIKVRETTRPALRTLSENCCVGKPQN